jgi:CDP-glucose 4,6-dehydratase
MSSQKKFWKNKRVLVTGHTGFKGAWLVQWLHHLGAHVIGVSLDPKSNPNLFSLAGVDKLCDSFIGDIGSYDWLDSVVSKSKPEIAFHLAAQSLVRYGYDHPQETYATNVMGTVNLLSSLLKQCDLRVCVVVTTDKVYKNNESKLYFKESDQLGGGDPYSSSKAACELVVSCFKNPFFNKNNSSISTARAGNVIGGGDWAVDRIVPDIINAWQHKEELIIRNPTAIRPWQHVLEPLNGYIKLAEKSWGMPTIAGAYNFGPKGDNARSVQEIATFCKHYLNDSELSMTFSMHEYGNKLESQYLMVDSSKAIQSLGYTPVWDCELALGKTIQWYLDYFDGASPYKLCLDDIGSFETSRSLI